MIDDAERRSDAIDIYDVLIQYTNIPVWIESRVAAMLRSRVLQVKRRTGPFHARCR